MSLVISDDAAMLAIYWLLASAIFCVLWARGARLWREYSRRMEREAYRRALGAPDRSVHRAGSVHDFQNQMARRRWP